MPRGAACGSALPVGPLSLLLCAISSLSTSAIRVQYLSPGAVGRAFPTATVAFVYSRSHLREASHLCPLRSAAASVHRGGRTCFPAMLTYLLEDLHSKVNWFIAYVAVDPNECLTSLIQGVVRVVSKVRLSRWGCGFPA